MLDLRQFRSKAAGLADLLNYSNVVAPGTVLCKDGMLLAGAFFAGPDIASRTVHDRIRLCERINAALLRLGSGWATWVDAVSLPAADYPAPERSHFPDPVSRMIDEERRQHFLAEGEHFESEYAVVFGFLPPLKRERRLLRLIYDDDETGPPVSDASRILAEFRGALRSVESAIGDAVRFRWMRECPCGNAHGVVHARDELVNYLRVLISGDTAPLNLPPDGSYLDCALAAEEFYPGDQVKVGADFVAVVAIEGFPSVSIPQILEAVDHLGMPLRFSTRFLHLDQHEALAELKRYRRQWKQKERGFVSQLLRTQAKMGEATDQHAAAMVGECDAVTKELNGAQVAAGYYTANIVLRSPDRGRVEQMADAVGKIVQKLGFATRVETVNTTEAWLGSLPGNTAQNVRRPLMLTDRLAHLLPLTSVWTGEGVCPNPLYPPDSPPLLHAATTGATPFRLNLDGHILGFGPTGAGKSTLEALICAQAFRYAGMQVTSFDYKRGLMATAKALGGRHYDIAGAGGTALCPFAVLETDNDMAWASDLAATMFELQQGRPPAAGAERDAIYAALRLMRRPGEGRSMTHFHALVQNAAVQDAFRFYTGDGPAGHLLDAEEDGISLCRFNVFEMEALLGLGAPTVVPTLLTLFRRFEASLTGAPAILDLQEAWVLLLHPAFKDKIFAWLRTMRSKNVTVMLWTQSLAEVMESGMMSVLTESCPNTFYLPNVDALTRGSAAFPGPRDFYEAKGLNENQVEIIRSGTYKRHYYLVTPQGCRLFDLGLGPVAKRFVGATSMADAARINALEQVYGDAWPYVWLEEGGIDYEHLVPAHALPRSGSVRGAVLHTV